MYIDFKDVVLVPQKSVVESRFQCDISAVLGNRTFKTPVVAANMKSILTPSICELFDANNWFYVYHRIDGTEDVFNFVKVSQERFNVVSISIGIKEEWITLLKRLKSETFRVDYITVDVAHSFNDNVLPVLHTIRDCYPDAYVIFGNGCTSKWAQWAEGLELVNCLKVGIGVSASCRTRQFTGFGSSTLGSLRECAAGCGLDIMSDGGITIQGDTVCIGDVAKAIVFGADCVMSGALFSQCLDSPAVKYGYYGNASRESKGNNHVEGTLVNVKSNGLTIKEQMKLIEDSLKSSVSYAGVKDIASMYCTEYKIIEN